MKAPIVYDSQFGNTGQIAQAIGTGLGPKADVEILLASDVKAEHLTGTAFLIVGSPTQRFRPTEGTTNFRKRFPKGSLNGVKVAAFDTRLTEEEIKKSASWLSSYDYLAMPPSPSQIGFRKKVVN